MKSLVLTALIAGTLAGMAGFGVGRRTAERKPERMIRDTPAALSTSTLPRGTDEHSSPKKADEIASTPTPAAPDVPTDEAQSSKRKLINLLGSLLPEDKLYHSLRSAAVTDPAIQKRVFEEFMATRDTTMLDAAKECFFGVKDPALVQQIVDAFGAETWQERKSALAMIIGMNLDSDATRTLFEAIVTGSDARTVESALERASVQAFERHAEFASRMTAQLRHLVTSGATPEMRARAAAALRGDRSKEGVEFLIDRMLRDPDPNVQSKAMVALPVTYSSGGPFEEEQYRSLLQVAQDESRSEKMRRWAAGRVQMGAYRYKNLLTEEQKALIMKLAERKDEPLKGKYN